MTAILIALLATVILGLPLALLVDRSARAGLLLGLSFLYGSGLEFLVLLVLSLAGIAWSLPSVTMVLSAIVLAAWWMVIRRAMPAAGTVDGSSPEGSSRFDRWSWIGDALSAFTLFGYTLFATLATPGNWDAWAIWMLKGRVFFEHRGIDWRFLQSEWNRFAHPDYPLLVPLQYDFLALVHGAWDDRWLGLLFVAYATALLLIVRDLAKRELAPLPASVLVLCCATFAITRHLGMAEGPLIAFGGAALLFLRRALLFDDRIAMRHGALLLGLAANCKDEGITLAAVAAISIAFVRPRQVVRLWPALVLLAPWLILRRVEHLSSWIESGSGMGRALDRATHWSDVLLRVARDFERPWFWWIALAALLIVPLREHKRERFVLLTIALQFALFLVAYFVTPYDLQWHIETSWSRIVLQLAVPLAYVVSVQLTRTATSSARL